MIDDMVVLLGEEQTTDDNKKEECEANIDETEDKHKDLNVEFADLGKATEETIDNIAPLTELLLSARESRIWTRTLQWPLMSARRIMRLL